MSIVLNVHLRGGGGGGGGGGGSGGVTIVRLGKQQQKKKFLPFDLSRQERIQRVEIINFAIPHTVHAPSYQPWENMSYSL